ncbi:MAG: exodeoxyribonuclease V subunit beta [Deltaproteobacteria bacterium]|nr:exodeoxyribonuclease V subunit beta [Deltaproteobacteria bacterium]
MKELDPININLHGTHLIEASAGTGKTYAITGIYLRLILERRLAVENILVVTFTEAACQELKDKIRARLALAHRICRARLGQGGGFGAADAFLEQILAKYAAQGQDLHDLEDRLALAMMDFDLAAVYTIHGFCLRVLQDSAFESSFPFEIEFIESDSDLLQQVIDDYWRINSRNWPAFLVDYLCHREWTPDTLIKILSPLLAAARTVGHSALHWPSLISPGQIPTGLCKSLMELWQSERRAILAALASPALRKTADTYKPENISAWAAQLDNFAQDMAGFFPFAAVEAFSQKVLIRETKPSKAGQTPEHNFFKLCGRMTETLEQAAYGALHGFLEQCLAALPELKRLGGLVSYDDLLGGVHDGLCRAETGRQLARRVGRQYPVALIDEFQDTDARQYDIFKRIYHQGGTLFMVGDPKQAIYSFRGADIFSYLTAAGNVESSHTLTTNWRADPDLTGAVNFLFGRHQAPFVLPQIKFSAAVSPPDFKACPTCEYGDEAPLTLYYFPEQKNRDSARRQAAAWVANRIKNILAEAAVEFGRQEGADGHGQGIDAGDIAVLVRRHSEGEMVRQALGEVGLSAIVLSNQSVYAAAPARELELIMRAVCRAGHEKSLRAALCTRILGATAQELADLDNERWESLLLRFGEYQKFWRERGPAPMLYNLLRREGVYLRLSAQEGAERLLTNIRHLIELLQTASHEQALGPEELLAWLAVRRHDENSGEDCQIRLESDENLIKIVTVHKSKGLQYPVVFCPFFWDSRGTVKGDLAVSCHENNRLVVDIGRGNSARIEQRDREALAEELRLLYVAMTRAKHRCYLLWGRVKAKSGGWATAASPLQYLLGGQAHAQGDLLAALQADFASVTDDFLADAKLEEDANNRIAVRPAVAAITEISGFVSGEKLHDVRELRRGFNRYLGVTSFSALHRGVISQANEEPDHDRLVEAAIYDSAAANDREMEIFNFPRGAQAGSCLHEILEEFDFQKTAGEQEKLILEKLTLYGIGEAWLATACLLVDNTMLTPLNATADLSLACLSPQDRLAEMEFYYPVPAVDNNRLAAMFRQGRNIGLSHEPEAPHGFMKGFIDLIFCWQGRYYIVDYKSNFLGGSLEDYNNLNLPDVIRQAGYDLQYSIYTEALHRYLGQRLPAYDPNLHFGGVYYLFLRGLRPAAGRRYGVYSANMPG